MSPPCTPHAQTFRTLSSGLSEAEPAQKTPQLSHAPTGTTLDYGNSAINLETPTPPHSGGHVPYPDRMPDSYLDSYVDTKVDTPKLAESEPKKTTAEDQSTLAKGDAKLTGQTMPAQDTQVDSPSSNGNDQQPANTTAEHAAKDHGNSPGLVATQPSQVAAPQQVAPVTNAPAPPCQQQPQQAAASQQVAPVTNAPAPPCQQQPTQETQPDKSWVTQQPPSNASTPALAKKNKYQDGTYWKSPESSKLHTCML